MHPSRLLAVCLCLAAAPALAAPATPAAPPAAAPAVAPAAAPVVDEAKAAADAKAKEEAEKRQAELAQAVKDAVLAAQQAAQAAKEAAEASKQAAADLRQSVQAKEAPAAAPAAPAAPKPSAWNYQIGVALVSVTGNAEAVTGKLSGKAEGKWGLWAASVKGGATYGQSTVNDATGSPVKQTNALNADLALRGDRGFTDKVGVYVTGGALTDHVASIQQQTFGEAGVGMIWFEDKEADFLKSKLRTDLGFRYTHEIDRKYYPEVSFIGVKQIYAPRISASFRYALSRTAVFTEDFEVLPDIMTAANVRGQSVTALTAQIAAGLALSMGFKVRYIGQPAAGAKKTDTELSAGVTWSF